MHEANRNNDGSFWNIDCVQCGRTFQATRIDASFCGVNCRVAYSREPEKLRKAIEAVRSQKTGLKALARKYKKNRELHGALCLLLLEVGQAVAEMEEQLEFDM